MSFNSLEFLIFFPLVSFLYFIFPYHFRWILLLVASCYFYMRFIPAYILILLTMIFIDYWAAIFIEKSSGEKRKFYLIISVISTCSVLFIFKYFNFFNINLAGLIKAWHWNYSLQTFYMILPLGLSFHTFQSLSYVMEVYYGRQKTEKHFGYYALYVMFFPQLVSGPIERPQHLLPQLHQKSDFDYVRVTDGLKLMLWGMFKKVVIADRLAILVNQVYDQPSEYQALMLITATIFFAFQIYCDFSGYSDIAIGCAQVLGIQLIRNFDRPYSAQSISEFWHRWHISLSTWFRDYLYIPLGGNRVSKMRWYFNILITFLVSGIWHGANWTFMLWGLLHGFYYLFGSWTKKIRGRLVEALGLTKIPMVYGWLRTMTTFLLVSFAWIFFRASSLQDAFFIIFQMLKGWKQAWHDLYFSFQHWAPIVLNEKDFLLSVSLILFLEIVQRLAPSNDIGRLVTRRPVWIRWPIYIGLTLIIMNLGITEDIPFIYFQF